MSEYVRGRANPNLGGLLKKARGAGVVAEIATAPDTLGSTGTAPPAGEASGQPVAAPQAAQIPVVQSVPQAPPAQGTVAPQVPVQLVPAPQAQYQPAAAQEPPAVQEQPPAPEPAPEVKEKMVKTSVRHTEGDAARVRATYIATMRMHRRRSMSDWLNDVILAECVRLEGEYNDGAPFDDDPELPRGRPIIG